jgi:glutamate--cysteine ligase
MRAGREVALCDWAHEVLDQCRPYAQALDSAHGTQDYSAALAQALERLEHPERTPSAHVLAELTGEYGNSFSRFTLARSEQARDSLLALPWSAAQQQRFEQWSAQSVQDQRDIEAADTLSFEEWRLRYMSPENLR